MVRVFPHSNLEIEVLGVTIDEVRVPRRRWPGYRVADRCLGEIHEIDHARLLGRPLEAFARDLRRPGAVHDARPGTTPRTAPLVRPAGRLLPALDGSGPRRRQDGQSVDLCQGRMLFVLRQAGVPATDPALSRGVAWLLANQRVSGRWFTRSLNNDAGHYITHAGTAFAVLALRACEVSGDQTASAPRSQFRSIPVSEGQPPEQAGDADAVIDPALSR